MHANKTFVQFKSLKMKKLREEIQQTQTFKDCNKLQQTLTLKKTNLGHIKHGITVAKNIGLEKWKSMCQFNERNKSIVEEIFINQIEVIHAKV